jgi:hypothetical protein
MTIAFILEGGQIASQALHKKLGLLPTCSICLVTTQRVLQDKSGHELEYSSQTPWLYALPFCPQLHVARVIDFAIGIPYFNQCRNDSKAVE